jgi:tRNA A-37 threonylcarbamoyl transferase component Bud32
LTGPEVEHAPGSMRCKLCQKVWPAGSGWICSDDNGQLETIGSDPLVGTVFDNKYMIESVLGQGGMSIVYKARHKYMDRIVAVKLLRENLVDDQMARLRFEQESKAASKLYHQNIVSVFDFGFTANGQAYFVMDCLEGDSLADVIEREGHIEVSRSIDIFRQICDGLEPAHKLGMIHRDLKPSNVILIKQEGSPDLVKIVDFGIAKFMPRDGVKSMSLTQTGEVFGSPMYMSPEQCQGQSLDTRSDIYSIGCLMYETLTGKPPFFGDTFLAIAMQHMSAPTPSFSQTAPGTNIPSAIEATVMKCMSKEPENRFQTISEVRQAMLDAALLSGIQGVRPGAVADPAPGVPQVGAWHHLKVSIGTQAAIVAREAMSPIRMIFIGMPLALLIAAAAFCMLWPGPEGDHGTPWQKLQWTWLMSQAQDAYGHQQYDRAKTLLDTAHELSTRLGDHEDRRKRTVELQQKVYTDGNMYELLYVANKEFAEILAHQMYEDLNETRMMLDKLKKAKVGGIAGSMSQAQAKANASRVLLMAKRLQMRSAYPIEETLLNEAIKIYNGLDLNEQDSIADFKAMLADCLILQQRLTKVRPLLADSLEIHQRIEERDKTTFARRELINSWLKLGQFDRNQSYFLDSQLELETALDLTKKWFGTDNTLMAEAYNGLQDLARQMNDKEAFAKYSALAKPYMEKVDTEGEKGLESPPAN